MNRRVRPRGVVVVGDTWLPSVRLAFAYVERNLGAASSPTRCRTDSRWRRRLPLERGVPRGRGAMAVLRLPPERPALAWDSFVRPF